MRMNFWVCTCSVSCSSSTSAWSATARCTPRRGCTSRWRRCRFACCSLCRTPRGRSSRRRLPRYCWQSIDPSLRHSCTCDVLYFSPQCELTSTSSPPWGTASLRCGSASRGPRPCRCCNSAPPENWHHSTESEIGMSNNMTATALVSYLFSRPL